MGRADSRCLRVGELIPNCAPNACLPGFARTRAWLRRLRRTEPFPGRAAVPAAGARSGRSGRDLVVRHDNYQQALHCQTQGFAPAGPFRPVKVRPPSPAPRPSQGPTIDATSCANCADPKPLGRTAAKLARLSRRTRPAGWLSGTRGLPRLARFAGQPTNNGMRASTAVEHGGEVSSDRRF